MAQCVCRSRCLRRVSRTRLDAPVPVPSKLQQDGKKGYDDIPRVLTT